MSVVSTKTKDRLLVAGLLGCVVTSPVAQAADDRAYDCKFDGGSFWNYENGVFGAEATTPLSFKVSKIDRARQKAELTTQTGRTDLKVVAAIDALHFIEVTVSGYLNLTTIYGEGENGSPIPAVHSRHLGIVGQPVGGQITGFCKKVES